MQKHGERGSAGSVVASAVVPLWVLGRAAMAVAAARASLGGGAASAAAGASGHQEQRDEDGADGSHGAHALRSGRRIANRRRYGMGVDVTGVSELVLEVVDLEAVRALLRRRARPAVVERWPEREAIWVMAGERTRIGLWRPQVGLFGGRGGIHVHFAMHIAPERYDAAVAHLRDKGQEVVEHEFPGYGGSRAAYVDDPDGNVVELWTWDVAQHLTSGG